jgi:ankyrin repeat protein
MDNHLCPGLCSASIYGHYDCVTTLLSISDSTKINSKNHDGDTPLHLASRKGYYTCVKALLDNVHTDINAKGSTGWTPLHYAVSYCRKDCVMILLDYGADVNVPDDYGCTPLHVSTSISRTDFITILLDHGADVNIQNNKGETPYDLANQSTKDFIYYLQSDLKEPVQ